LEGVEWPSVISPRKLTALSTPNVAWIRIDVILERRRINSRKDNVGDQDCSFNLDRNKRERKINYWW
jgi:hypothetical protein